MPVKPAPNPAPATGHSYTIHEFSAMTGLPQSKIRYYEKLGLFSGRRLENGYRVYDLEDSFRASAFRNLLLYGFSVEQAIRMLDEKQSTEQFTLSLRAKQDELERQKQLLEYRLHALHRSLHFIEKLPDPNDFSLQDREDLLYVQAPSGRDKAISEQSSRAFTRFTGMLGISRFTRIIRLEELTSRQQVEPLFVSSLPAAEAWRLEGLPAEQVHRLSMGKCLMYHRVLSREDSVKAENFAPMLHWLADHGYRVRSDFVIHPTFLNLDGRGLDVETVVVPIT